MLIEEKLRELIGNHISTQTCQSIVEGTMGLHAGAIMKVCREFAILTKSEPHENEHQIVMHAISNISRFYTFELSRPLTPISWEEIGGYQLVVKRLRHIVSQWEYSSEEGSERKNFLFSSCKGVLLIGPSGCGKTFLARAVSGQRGLNFINFNMYG